MQNPAGSSGCDCGRCYASLFPDWLKRELQLRAFHHRQANVLAVAVFLQFLALVVSLPTFGQTDSNFDATVFEVDIQRHQREALLLSTLVSWCLQPSFTHHCARLAEVPL